MVNDDSILTRSSAGAILGNGTLGSDSVLGPSDTLEADSVGEITAVSATTSSSSLSGASSSSSLDSPGATASLSSIIESTVSILAVVESTETTSDPLMVESQSSSFDSSIATTSFSNTLLLNATSVSLDSPSVTASLSSIIESTVSIVAVAESIKATSDPLAANEKITIIGATADATSSDIQSDEITSALDDSVISFSDSSIIDAISVATAIDNVVASSSSSASLASQSLSIVTEGELTTFSADNLDFRLNLYSSPSLDSIDFELQDSSSGLLVSSATGSPLIGFSSTGTFSNGSITSPTATTLNGVSFSQALDRAAIVFSSDAMVLLSNEDLEFIIIRRSRAGGSAADTNTAGNTGKTEVNNNATKTLTSEADVSINGNKNEATTKNNANRT